MGNEDKKALEILIEILKEIEDIKSNIKYTEESRIDEHII